MASRITPKGKAPLHIEEWLTIRGKRPADLAGDLNASEAAISRWISGHRRPDSGTIRAIEEVLHLPPGGLYRSPEAATRDELLADLTEPQRKEALRFIGYLRSQSRR